MKKAILFIALLIGAFAFAQTGYELPALQYQQIKQKISELSDREARNLANEMAQATGGFVYYKTDTGDDNIQYLYAPTNSTPAQTKEREQYGFCKGCLIITFRGQPDNRKFYEVVGTFEDLFPIWKNEFLPSATAQNTKDNFKYRDVKSSGAKLDVRLQHLYGAWQIHNYR